MAAKSPAIGLVELTVDAATEPNRQAASLRDAVLDAIAAADCRILADCSALSVLGSGLLAVLIGTSELDFGHRGLALVLTPRAKDALDAWRIDTGWAVFTEIDEAKRFLDAGGLQ